MKSWEKTYTSRPSIRPHPVTTPSPGNDVLVQAEVGRAVGDEAVELDEAALVQQEVEPLARGELAFLVLLRHARGAPALFGERLAVVELVQQLSGVGHGRRI